MPSEPRSTPASTVDEALVWTSDWLGSDPIFYNERTGSVAREINDVIDFTHLEIDHAGLADYLDFGYCAFGHTPVQGVKVLTANSELTIGSAGTITVRRGDDPAEALLERRTNEADVLDSIRHAVEEWETEVDGEICVPLSGGYDSRLLVSLLRDKTRVRAFTYGLSDNQLDSSEVVYARELSLRLRTKWAAIELGDYHRHLDAWDALYGCSSHAHGMYHIEFYSKIRDRYRIGGPLLSGVIGDAWSGNVSVPGISKPDDLLALGYRHGLHADSNRLCRRTVSQYRLDYFDRNREKLADPRRRTIEAMRLKMILLSYLARVPRHLGFEPWSPFLDCRIAMSMLCLPEERRQDRRWQQQHFRDQGIDVEAFGLPCTRQNSLNLRTLARNSLPPLRTDLLEEFLERPYLDWINRTLSPANSWDRAWKGIEKLTPPPLFHRLSRFRSKAELRRLTAYHAYLTLRPIERLLARRHVAHTA